MEEKSGKPFPYNEKAKLGLMAQPQPRTRGGNLGSVIPWAQHHPALPLGKAAHPFLSQG